MICILDTQYNSLHLFGRADSLKQEKSKEEPQGENGAKAEIEK